MLKKAEGVAKGAFFLTLAGLLVKVVGMIYKIPLTNRLGDEGMGYFNAAYTVYTLFFVLSASGFPTALSLSVSGDLAGMGEEAAKRRYRVVRRFLFFFGFGLSFLLFLSAKPLSYLFGSPKAYLAILAVSPAVWFVTASSARRGYDQGRGSMLSTAISQLIEALGKLGFGLFLLTFAVKRGYSSEKSAALSILGLSLATLLTYLVLVFGFGSKQSVRERISRDERRALLRDIVRPAIPITASALAATLASSLDLVLLMRSLQSIGYSPDAANAAWGNYSSMVLPLFHMPQVLITPIALSVLPLLKRSLAKKDLICANQLTRSALIATALFSACAALGLSLFSRDALMLVYTDEAAVAHAYPHLALLALAVFPFGLMTVSASLLQAHGKLWFPTVSLMLGSLLKIAVTLLGVSALGESVSAWGTLLSYTFSAALNFAALAKRTRLSVWREILPKPLLTATGTVLLALLCQSLCHFYEVGETLSTLFSMAFAALSALVLTAAFRIFKKEDLEALGVLRESR